MSQGKAKGPKFEEAIEELETIIEKIESGQCGLEECIAEYEKGVKLLTRCQSILQVVQQRIAELTTDAAGRLQVKDGAQAGPAQDGKAADDSAEAEFEDDDNLPADE